MKRMARENTPAPGSRGLGGARKRASTATSGFGVSRRESHDSSKYYNSKMYSEVGREHDTGKSVELPSKVANSVICGDSRNLAQIPDNSVHLMVTSPPYNASKEYDEDLGLGDYLTLLRQVFAECHRVLVPGGRAVINVANLGRKPYIPLSSHINLIMNDLGFLQRGEIIWDKSASAGSSCAWGSFASASNPCLRDVHEYILVYSKGVFKLPRTKEEKSGVRADTIDKKEFVELTKSIWRFPTVSAKRVGHPAPFPVELPRRCIEMYTFAGDVVLDPFLGSGQTAIAALQTGRRYIGVDLSEEYCELARNRISEAENAEAENSDSQAPLSGVSS
jgi:site-specific DNA-methyltransferase (adenine-specific)